MFETDKLVARIQSGDDEACEILFARYLPRVLRSVALKLGVRRNELDAEVEDIAQDALCRGFKSMSQFENRREGAFRSWMATIVDNCLRSKLRSKRSNGEQALWQRFGDIDLCESVFAAGGPSPVSGAASLEANERIEAAMLQLSKLHRQVLAMRAFEGLSFAEIALALGRTEVNARKLFQRAQENLAPYL
ncbi:MAG: polymerase sigma-D factor [Planctomycetota bacterium]|jgi:RNA polymerase sigma-70 factor (ECF subfamily)